MDSIPGTSSTTSPGVITVTSVVQVEACTSSSASGEQQCTTPSFLSLFSELCCIPLGEWARVRVKVRVRIRIRVRVRVRVRFRFRVRVRVWVRVRVRI